MNIKQIVYGYQTKYPEGFTIDEESHLISLNNVDIRNYSKAIGKYTPEVNKYGELLRPKWTVYIALRTSIELDGTVHGRT